MGLKHELVEAVDWLVLTRKTWFDDRAVRFWKANFSAPEHRTRELSKVDIQIAGRRDLHRGIG